MGGAWVRNMPFSGLIYNTAWATTMGKRYYGEQVLRNNLLPIVVAQAVL